MAPHKYFLSILLSVYADSEFSYLFFFSPNMQSEIEREEKKETFYLLVLRTYIILYHLKSDENRFYNISSILRFILNLNSINNKVAF